MSIHINLLPRKVVRERVWKTLNVVVGLVTLFNVSMVGALIVPKVANAATTSLTVQVLSWNTIGIDSNKPTTQGPDRFLIQARVTNTGPATATSVYSSFAFHSGTGDPYISLVSPSSPFPLNSITAGQSKDVFYVVQIARDKNAYGTFRPYTISISSPDASTVTSDLGDQPQQLTVEQLISQNRNSVQSTVVSPVSPLVGQPFTVTVVTTTTGNGNFDNVSPLMTYDPSLATLDSVTTHYDIPGVTETDIYGNNVGGTMTSVFHFRATAAGTQHFFYLIYDQSGGSYHYNQDFGSAINVPVQPQPALSKTVDKATANPGDSLTYTLNYANTGNIDLQNVTITETYSSWFTFSNSTPAPTSGNNVWSIGTLPVGATGSVVIHGTLSSSFPFGTTNVHNLAVMNSQILNFDGQLESQPPISATADTSVYVAPFGSLQLTKIVDSGSASASDFGFTISPDPNTVGAVHTSAGTTGTYTFASLPAGQYTVTEAAKAGYHQVSTTCANVQVTAGQQATCVVHNARDTGTIQLNKIWSGTPGQTTLDIGTTASASDIAAQLTGLAGTAPLTTGVKTVPTGTYYLSENGGLTNYHSALTCTDNGAPVTPGTNNAVTVAYGHAVICAYTNTRDTGNVNFVKVVDNQPSADLSQFTFHANGNAYHNGSSATFDTGAYALTEDPVSGYSFVSATGVCRGSDPSNLTLTVDANGGTCTITNHRDTGTLVVQKTVINPDGQPVTDDHQFTVSVSGQSNGTIAENQNATYTDLPTGNYTVTELPDGSYTFVSYSLDNNSNAADGAQVTITKNATTTLTVTNEQKKVEVIVHKQVVGIDGVTPVVDTHSFTANVNAASGPIAEGTDFTTWVNPGNVAVGENPDPNYGLVGIDNPNFTVTSGQSPVNVTVTNKQLPAHITVYKDVRAWDGTDTSDSHTFMVTLDSQTKNFSESAPVVFDVAPGTYSAVETPDANYTLGSILPGSVTVASNGTASITITNLQNKVFDWTVTKSAPTTVQAGGQMTYDVSWQVNPSSNTQLANMVITDPLPAHTTFVSATDGGTLNGGTVTWNLTGPFTPGQTGMVHVTVNVDNHLDPLTIHNVATVCGTEQPYFPILSFAALSATNVNPNYVCKDGSANTQVLSSYTMAVSKTDNRSTIDVGATDTYTIHWSATGNAATTSALVLSDPLPTNTTFVSADHGGTYNGGVVTWNLGSQTLDAAGDVQLVVTVAPIVRNGTDLHNLVTLCDASQTCVTGDDHTTILSAITLEASKADSVNHQAIAGTPYTYTINWTVGGSSPVDQVTISDVVPTNLTYVPGSASNGGSYNSGSHTLTWTLTGPSGPFMPGDHGSVTFNVTSVTPIQSGTPVFNTATVCATANGTNVDHNLSQCQSPTDLTIITSDFGVAVVKTGTPDPVVAGNNITYTLTWSVTGTSPVDDLVITDALPANTSFVSATNGGTNNAGTITWDLGPHFPGDTNTVTLVVKTASPMINGAVIPNSATICGQTGIHPDLAITADQPSTIIEHCSPGSTTTTVTSSFGVSIVKTGPATVIPGNQMTYSLAWSVSGNTPISTVTITDALPANTTFVSASNGGTNTAGTVTWNLPGPHAANDSGIVTLTVAVTSPLANGTVISNTGQICATANNANETTTKNCRTSTTTTTVSSSPTLSITKTNDVVGFTNPGKTVTYTVTVTNAPSATDAANAVVLTDVLPAGFTYTGIGGTTRTFNLGTITPGTSVVTTYSANISAAEATGLYTNTANAAGSNTAKVSATSTVDVRVPSVLGVSATPNLTVTKTVDHGVVNPGNLVTYTVTIANPGDGDLSNVVLTDNLPAGFIFLSSGLSTQTWSIGTLLAHHQRVVDYLVKVGTTVKAGTYDNLATVTSDQLDPQTAKAPVQVLVPKVLGLATTGVSARDYVIFTLGLGLMALGLYWAGRQRRQTDASHV